MITPTVGRVVWFFKWNATQQAHKGPLSAQVAFVHPDNGTVNLMVIDESGNPHGETNVPLIQDVEQAQCSIQYSYCTWMPYQKAVSSGQLPPTLHAQPPHAVTGNERMPNQNLAQGQNAGSQTS